MKRLITYVLVSFITLMLSACGFHLRGTGSEKLTIKDMSVKAGDTYGTLVKQLKERLTEAGVKVHDDAIYKLNVTESWDSRTLTYSNAIRGTEIEKILTLHYQVYGSSSLLLVDNNLEARGVYIYDTNNIVANECQENALDDRLTNEGIELLIDRLQGISTEQLDQLQQKAEQQLKLRQEAEKAQQKALQERQKSILNTIPLEDIQKYNQQKD